MHILLRDLADAFFYSTRWRVANIALFLGHATPKQRDIFLDAYDSKKQKIRYIVVRQVAIVCYSGNSAVGSSGNHKPQRICRVNHVESTLPARSLWECNFSSGLTAR